MAFDVCETLKDKVIAIISALIPGARIYLGGQELEEQRVKDLTLIWPWMLGKS